MPPSLLELRPAVAEDAAVVADLDTAAQPDDPRDPVMTAFWWQHHVAGERVHRLIATRDGVAHVFVFAGHQDFELDAGRFGSMRVRLHPETWSEGAYREAVEIAEAWLREEG